MTIQKWLKKAIQLLKDAAIPTPSLDAELLLADVLCKDRSWLHANSDEILNMTSIRLLDSRLQRRMKHEPIAYIRGKQEFYRRDFIVSPDTLTPRAETETMIDLLLEEVYNLQLTSESQPQIIDVGTGSGCIIITAALELKTLQKQKNNNQFTYYGLDISNAALSIAQQNAHKLGAVVNFKLFDLTKEYLPLHTDGYVIITANLPYVPTNYQINLAATHEPELAIYGGSDGLEYYRILFNQLKTVSPTLKNSSCFIFTESLPLQHDELQKIAVQSGFKESNRQDFIQVFFTNY